jgi:hypothetical protein
VETWIQIQAEPQTIARASRLSIEEVPYLHLCEWLLLAWSFGGYAIARKLKLLQDPKYEPRFLGSENPQE